MSIFQPSNQIKLTNVSVIRYRKKGKRFELALYPNKIMDWRNGVEKRLDQVLQIATIFVNVGKGQQAAADDLQKCFGTRDNDAIILEIL